MNRIMLTIDTVGHAAFPLTSELGSKKRVFRSGIGHYD